LAPLELGSSSSSLSLPLLDSSLTTVPFINTDLELFTGLSSETPESSLLSLSDVSSLVSFSFLITSDVLGAALLVSLSLETPLLEMRRLIAKAVMIQEFQMTIL
jgi:hypothetical protein